MHILIDVIVGGIVSGLISLSSSTFGGDPNYYKILAFTWALPITLPYLLYVVKRGSTENGMDTQSAISNFLKHSFMGFSLGVVLVVIGMCLPHSDVIALIRLYAILIVTLLVAYFYKGGSI